MVKNPPANAGDSGDASLWVRRIPLEEGMAIHSIFLCGESLGQRSLVGYSPQGGKNWTLEQLSMYTHVVVNASIIHTWK